MSYGVRLTIKLDDREMRRALTRGLSAVKSPGALLKPIGQAVLNNTRERFFEMVDPDGNAWAPLSPLTIAKKKLKNQILVETQGLFNSLSAQMLGLEAIEVGTNKIYAPALQFGSKPKPRAPSKAKRGYRTLGPGAGMSPPRPFLGVSAKDRKDILGVCDRAFRRAFGN